MLISLLRLAHRLGEDVANVLVRLNAVTHARHLGLTKVLSLSIGHLLLLEEEILLLLLEHPLLENLLQLNLYLLWEVLLLNQFSILVIICLLSHFTLILSILEKLNDLLSGEVISDIGDLSPLNVGGLLVLLLALSIFLLR
jgi:hypothetical protein